MDKKFISSLFDCSPSGRDTGSGFVHGPRPSDDTFEPLLVLEDLLDLDGALKHGFALGYFWTNIGLVKLSLEEALAFFDQGTEDRRFPCVA